MWWSGREQSCSNRLLRRLSSVLAALGVRSAPAAPPRRLRLAVVGDCHGQYNEDDNAALLALVPDAALFVGDYDNEAADIPRTIAKLHGALPVASIMGNHDAWYLSKLIARERTALDSASSSASSLAPGAQPRLGESAEFESVRQQHSLLAPSNVGWGRRDFEALPLSVVGGRPLSSGGASLERHARMYSSLWGVRGAEESAAVIAKHVRAAPPGAATVMLAHNGPSGLGSARDDICGKDWGGGGGGDWGDEDLRLALSDGGGQRSMVCRGADGRLYVNGARVPRWRTAPSGCGVERLFTMVDLEQSSGGWAAARVEQVWALPDGRVTEREPLWSVDDELLESMRE
ncbi:hypothetical protein EMIHUDRAFT_210358 [Emiliania huxleyi CCMP1516]|uniref:Calcineurin-like phosphoesterase domain-containing protein n=2 Tax=Emiliania huxleyi TaxID=2903 RepID=A0A0D3IZW6_EMIH1|nr:hypothetical protein EMIHUDRAFT_210358 [Emiliania huxleyi CCMP1516]EOD16801.1 hypothetical protein EMIHUDRAFT_210358 [Emiliania huxleyi CCMP1516]|eukprot:XP_005769230.1 hypothetical protein EMIHUDRAFT_210358 [Emiliania huxleyi CCMP1516]